jgi:hypothetical protein
LHDECASLITQENLVKLVKISATALAISAMLAGPVLAQGTSSPSDNHIGTGLQGRTSPQAAPSGSVYDQLNRQIGAPAETVGAPKPGVISPVATGSGAPLGTPGAIGGKH